MSAPPLLPIDPAAPSRPGDLRFGSDFYFGTQTSAIQVEGGGIDNDITRWALTHPGWAPPNPGLDHWNHFETDYQQLGADGHTAHGFTIDWARIEPEEGRFDLGAEALAHYRQEVLSCRRNGMEPMVTLLQYGLPPWLAEKGGILNPRAPELFARFTRAVMEGVEDREGNFVQGVGDEVTWWNTMNEPNTLAAAGYLAGIWPPGQKSIFQLCRAFDAQLRMHAASTRAIREVASSHGRRSMVSFAHNVNPHAAYRWWHPLDQAWARTYEYVANRWFLDSIEQGKSIWPVGNGDEIPGLKGSLDYLALNYYGRTWSEVGLGAKGDFGAPAQDRGNPDRPPRPRGTGDPDGLYQVALSLWNQFHLPVMITENGVDVAATNDRETRGRAIVDHLAAFYHLREAGVPILGYLHWTDWDSPEWHDGWTQHWGLKVFDPATSRTWDRASAAVFRTIARLHAIPEPWLSAENRQSPAERDGPCAREFRRAREWLAARVFTAHSAAGLGSV